MNQITKVFEGAELRILELNDQPWFVAIDVCKVLDLTNPTMVINRLDDDERAKFNLGRQGETNIVNESGLYEMIFASRKPEAKEFKRWVKREVLPEIRKSGSYQRPRTRAEAHEELLLLTSQDVEQLASDVKELKLKVDDQIRLFPSEIDDLWNAVANKSIALNRNGIENRSDEDFKKDVGMTRRRIWSKLKKRYSVSKYIHIKRKDFDDAMNYINQFRLTDLL